MVGHRRVAERLGPRQGRSRLRVAGPRRARSADDLPPQSVGGAPGADAAAGKLQSAVGGSQGPAFGVRRERFNDWGRSHAGYNADTASLSAYAFIGNAYIPGPDSAGLWAFEESNPLARAWFEGNAMDGQIPADAWSLVKDSDRPDYRMSARPDWAEAATGSPTEV